MTKQFTQNIPIAWHHIRDARKLVQEALAEHDRGLRDAAVMTMSELVENAMKYGESVPGMPGATFTLTVSDDAVCIEVTNGTTSTESLENLRSCIESMAKTPDRESLYVERLQEILQNPSTGGRLGLYRIGCEGRFDLSCTLGDATVTVTARRSIS